MRWTRNGYELDDARERLDMDQISEWIRNAYWALTRMHEQVLCSWSGSAVPFGLYAPSGEMAGCARVISDFVTTAYIADVFIDTAHRGQKLGVWMMESIISHPDLNTVRWLLHTRDAHGLYRKVGFDGPNERLMERPKVEI
jgi:GNAT superfamily N-acetyltransferase